MRDFIELSTVGEILLEEFMIPQNISEDKIAIDLEIPVSQIQDIVNDMERISPEISSQLGRYFQQRGSISLFFTYFSFRLSFRSDTCSSCSLVFGWYLH